MLDTQSLMEYVKRDAENLKNGIGKSEAQYNQSNIWLSVENCRADFRVCKCFKPQRAKEVEDRALKSKEFEYIFSNYCYSRCNTLIHSPHKKLKCDR